MNLRGKMAATLMASFLVLFSFGTVAADTTPWVQADQADYTPSSVVTLTGGNWQPAEALTISVNDTVGATWSLNDAATADDAGAFTYQFTLPDTFVSDYDVTVRGVSGSATASFTDAIGSISPTSGPEGVDFTLTVNRSGGTTWDSTTKIVFAGTQLTTTFVNSSQLRATVPASLIPEEGSKAVTTVGRGSGGTGTFTVTEGDVFSLTSAGIAAPYGFAFSGKVATLSDTYDNQVMTGVNATIAWGDNSSSAGTITRTGVGTYDVTGTHTYAAPFLQTLTRSPVTTAVTTLPITNNGTNAFASSGSLVVRTSTGFEHLTYTGKTSGTTASFTGVSGWSGIPTVPSGSPVTQSFAPASVTVTEAAPGNATATLVGIPLTVADANAYTDNHFTSSFYTEGVKFGGGNFATVPGSIAFNGTVNGTFYSMASTTDLDSTPSRWWTVSGSGTNAFLVFHAGTIAPLPSMTFPEEGLHSFTETLYRNDGSIAATATGNLTLGEAQFGYYGAVNSYNALEGASTGNIQIGNFIDYNPYADGSDYAITIHWGDGGPDTTAVTATPVGVNGSNQGTFTISAAHTYAEEGTYHATYDVVDGNQGVTGVSTATIVVSDPNVVATGATLSTDFAQAWASDVVATFTDPAGAEAADGTHYGATVDFGSGPVAATITESGGTFSVHATIPFTAVGSYSATIVTSHEASTPQSVTAAFTVNPADQTITFAALGGKTYGDADFTVSASASSNLPVSFTASGDCTVGGTTVHIAGAGSCTVTAHQAGNANFNAAPDVARAFAIAKAGLTVTADDKSVILHAPVPALTTTITGFALGEGPSVLTTQPSCSTTYTPTSYVGSYPITCSGAAADNYSFTYVAGAVKVGFTFGGFLQPINDTAHDKGLDISVFKGGSTIPVKFLLYDANGVMVQQNTMPDWLTPGKGAAMNLPIDESVVTDSPTTGSDYTWDGSQYHYNWQTKGFDTGYYWKIGVRLDGGQCYYVNIGLKK